MLPDLTILVALILGLMALGGPPADAVEPVVGTLLCVLVGSALSRMAMGRGLRALDDGEFVVAEISIRWTGTWPLLAWLAALFLFHWGTWIHTHVSPMWWLGRYVALFLPAAVMFGVGWVGRARIESGLVSRRGGLPHPSTPWAAIRRGLRRNAVALIPLGVVLGLTDGVWVLGEIGIDPMRQAALWREAMPLLDIALMLALVLISLPFIPLIFAKALHATPLPAGRVRDVLEQAAASIDLRYRDIMVWRTGGRVFNAMVVGFTGGTRTIFLTDGLLDTLPEDELIAVFFHEAGHAKRQHLPLFIVGFFALSLLFYALSDPLFALGVDPTLQLVLHLGVLWFGLLGWVSRRFERESDVYGAEHAALLQPDAPPLPVPGLRAPLPRGASLMMRALERIRTIVGTTYSHRHGSVEDRMGFVAAHATDPEVRASFRRTRRSILVGFAGLTGLAVVLTALRVPHEIRHAQAHVAAAAAFDAYREAWRLAHSKNADEVDAAPARWREAYDGFLLAAGRLEGMRDRQSTLARIYHTFGAADMALHGLRDPALAAPGFERALQLLDERELTTPTAQELRFQCHIELGRLAAWRAAEAVDGGARDLEPTLRHLQAARDTHLAALQSSEAFGEKRRLYFAERLRLLDATYEAARGEHAEARESLKKLAQLGGGSRRWEDRDWIEIAEDAQQELERLEGR